MRGLFTRSKDPVISANTLIGLSQGGRKRAEDYSETGVKYDVLISLQESEKTLRDLAHDIGMPIDNVRRELLRMRGYVIFHNDVG